MSELSILDAARERPEAPALVIDGGVRRFGELADDVRRAIGWLCSRGLAPGDPSARVALVARRDEDTLVLLHALIAAGWPVVPLHSTSTAAERAATLARLGPALLVDDPSEWRRHASRGDPPPTLDLEAPLAIVRTSGTTGEPRGVVLSRRAFAAAARLSAEALGSIANDRWLLTMPLAHVGGLSIPIRMLATRTSTVVEREGRFDAARFTHDIGRSRVTIASVVPTMLRRILDTDWRPPAHLRAVLVGGASAPPEMLVEARRRGIPVRATYGLTEACAQVATQRRDEVAGVGRPLSGVEVRIVEGEIQVRGPTLLSAVVGGADPRTPDGWLRTGDAGELDAGGRLHVHGRLDDVIVSGGENVWPAEVERVLLAQPGVREACAWAVPDLEWGEVVMAAIAGDADPDRLHRALRVVLAPYKRPRDIVILPDLPRTAAGKLDRRRVASVTPPRHPVR